LASATASGSKDSADVQKNVADVRRDIIARLKGRIDRDVVTGVLPETTSAMTLAAMVMAVIQGMSVLARDGMDRESLLMMARCALQGWPLSRIDA
jgi:hypothetical protein